MNDALADGHRFDVTQLPAFHKIELIESAGSEFPIVQPVIGVEYIQGRLGDVLLHTGLPGYVPSAHLVGMIEMLIGENPVE